MLAKTTPLESHKDRFQTPLHLEEIEGYKAHIRDHCLKLLEEVYTLIDDPAMANEFARYLHLAMLYAIAGIDMDAARGKRFDRVFESTG